MKTFNPTLAIPYIASDSNFIPSPWSQDPSATDNTTVVADASITPDGSNINLKVQDGWRWIQLGNPSHVYGYARTEINLTNQIGFTVFPAGVVTTLEWQGYFTTGLPAVLSGEPFVAPFQIHHLGGGSPPYALEVDTSDHLLYLYIHNIDGSFNRREVLMDFNDLVNVSTNIKANYKPNSSAGIADGSMQILIDGAEVFTESGVENCVVQNKDYAKVGIYDFTNAIVDPTDAGRGQSLEMIVENFSVYLAATPTRTHIDTSQAGVPVGGTTGQTLVKNSSTDFDYSWGTGGGSPAGSDTYVQYNDSGAFGGDSNFIWQKTNKLFQVGDIAGSSNKTYLLVADNGAVIVANSGQIFLGDVDSNVNGTTFYIDDNNQRYVFNYPNISISSVPYIFPSSLGTGPAVLTDLSGDGNLTWEQVVLTGSGAPGTTPGYVGQFYVDTSGAKLYFSKGTSSSADWVIAN